jgi:alpha-1,3/alpha-1,6-mannosyltransferase
VKLFTPYHDKSHCFPETRDGTLEVEVCGDSFPRSIKGKFIAFCAYLRMILATIYIIFYRGKFDVFIVDQVSVCVPLLRIFNRKCIFYCHFPDKLLCVERKSFLKKFYRFFLDFAEEFSMLFANMILVNSGFTREIYNNSFKILKKLKSQPEILYPAIEIKKFEESEKKIQNSANLGDRFYLSLNRYERKKNINLAIQAFAELKK